jgi:hypothetical protein
VQGPGFDIQYCTKKEENKGGRRRRARRRRRRRRRRERERERKTERDRDRDIVEQNSQFQVV